MQVLVPGKQNYSLVITWALDHDPVKTVHEIISGDAGQEPEEAYSEQGEVPKEGGAALLARRSLNMRKSQSLQDAAVSEVALILHSCCTTSKRIVASHHHRHVLCNCSCAASILAAWLRLLP